MRVVTFKLDEETLSELDKLSIRLGICRSRIIRAAILEYMQKFPNNRGLRVKEVKLK